MAKEKRESDIGTIKRLLLDMYEIRYNTIKQKAEFRIKETDAWDPVGKTELNTFRVELDNLGVSVSVADIKCVIESNAVAHINPVVEYFLNLPEYNPKIHGDPIKDLAATVKTVGAEFEPYFKRWIVGVAANALDPFECKNHLCLVLSGAQGTFKTTFLQHLAPKSLQRYVQCGRLNLENEAKDALTLIAENLIINIDDQLKELNKKDENALKNLITMDMVKYRRPYDPYIMEYPHLGSFCASVNGLDFLADPTGSRRFLAFEIDGKIDTATAKGINMDRVFSQAMSLLNSGFKYWLSDGEVDVLNEQNQRFAIVSAEEELITEYFSLKKPAEGMPTLIYLTNTMIKTKLEQKTNQRLSDKKLGAALHRLGYEKKQVTINGARPWVYALYELEHTQIEATRNGVKQQETTALSN